MQNVNRGQVIRYGLAALVAGIMLAGCAGRPPGEKVDVGRDSPPRAASVDSAIRAERDVLAAEVHELDAQLTSFRARNPNLTMRFDLTTQEVRLLAEKRLNAEMAAIDTRSGYASGHPQVEAATRREAEIARRCEEAIARLVELESLVNEYDRLSIALQEKRSELRRLDEYLFDARVRRR